MVVSVGDVAVGEGDTGTRTASFTLSLATPAASQVTVNYATAKASAVGSDFIAQSGTATFAPGTTGLIVAVAIVGDAVDEADETFRLVLSSPTGAIIGDGTGVGTIFDDDPPPAAGARLAIGDVSVHEGDAGSRAAVFNGSLSEPLAESANVSYATAKGTAVGTDFTARSGTLTVAPGTITLKIKVPITPDTLTEGNETLTVTLSTPNGASITDGIGLGTIIDDD